MNPRAARRAQRPEAAPGAGQNGNYMNILRKVKNDLEIRWLKISISKLRDIKTTGSLLSAKEPMLHMRISAMLAEAESTLKKFE